MRSPITDVMLIAATAAALVVLALGAIFLARPREENQLQFRWIGAVLAGAGVSVLVTVAVVAAKRRRRR